MKKKNFVIVGATLLLVLLVSSSTGVGMVQSKENNRTTPNVKSSSDVPLEILVIRIPSSTMYGAQAEIQNLGNVPLTNVFWAINLSGGIFGRLNNRITGTIPILGPHSQELIQSGSIFGFCVIRFGFSATCNEGFSATYNLKGFLKFHYIILRNN